MIARRAIPILAIVALVLVAVAAVGNNWPGRPTGSGETSGPESSPVAIPSGIELGAGGDPAFAASVPAVHRARASARITPAVAAGGAPMAVNGQVLPVEVGQDLVLFGEPVVVAGEEWQYGYVLPSDSGEGPDDYFAWFPRTLGGQPVMNEIPTECPAKIGLADIALLDPFTRVRCLGASSFAIEGRSWVSMLPVWYDVAPDWLGGPNEQVPLLSVHAGELQRLAPPGAVPRFLDVQLPPGVPRPPSDFTIRVAVHVADAAARACAREPGEGGLMPPEKPADTLLWCATRVVAETWLPLLGPEGRPIDQLSPQLHRWPEPGLNTGCAGVGLPPLTFSIDPTGLDPIKLTAAAQGGFGRFDYIPWFTPEFRAVFSPELVVVDATGRVVARDGQPVNPDAQLAGHSLCPTGGGVYID